MAAVSFEAVRKVYPDGTEAIPGLDLHVIEIGLDQVDAEFRVVHSAVLGDRVVVGPKQRYPDAAVRTGVSSG